MMPHSVQTKLSGEAAPPVRVLLVDDNPRFLDLTAAILKTDPRFEIVGRALSGREALVEISRLQPDMILMDVALPDLNGLELTRHLKKHPPSPCIIIVTTYADLEYQQAAQEANADGFLAKADLGLNLLPAIYALF
jgi:DNA-binding NarL/FixJ family response regulator